MSSVTQDWVQALPWKMQSVLMASTRGPDNHRYKQVKVVNRWIRGHLFHDADPANPFITKPGDFDIAILAWVLDEPRLREREWWLGELEHELEYVTVHYFGHLIHALEIIGYMHPVADVGYAARYLYYELCQRILHLPPETDPELRLRLADVTEHD